MDITLNVNVTLRQRALLLSAEKFEFLGFSTTGRVQKLLLRDTLIHRTQEVCCVECNFSVEFRRKPEARF